MTAICGYCRARFETEEALTEHDFAAHDRRGRLQSERNMWARFAKEKEDPNNWMAARIKEIDEELAQ